MTDWKGQKVAVIGLSVEGLDSIRYFLAHGASVTCCDRRSAAELGVTYEALKKEPVTFQLGQAYLHTLDAYDVIVRTPGMLLATPELILLRKLGKQVTSSIRVFFDQCKAPIIGVTGTKGKGTTSTLIAEMLRETGKQVYLGGNVGIPLLSTVDTIQPRSWVVLELSSFQLEDLTRSPHIAVVLRVTQDHLVNTDRLATNYHRDRNSYVEAKKSIVRYQSSRDVVIVHADDPTSRAFAEESSAPVRYFGMTDTSMCFVRDGAVYLREHGAAKQICSKREIILRGEHNLENIAAATLAARCAGATLPAIRKTTRTFKGLPHRLEFVRTVKDVSYFDDSFSTVPETTIAAVRSFSEPIILIAGGAEKGSDFSVMGEAIAASPVRYLLLMGTMTDRIVSAAVAAGFPAERVKTGFSSMHDIVGAAYDLAQPGGVVVLSPACASFDMFTNYKDRGDQFKHEVEHL